MFTIFTVDFRSHAFARRRPDYFPFLFLYFTIFVKIELGERASWLQFPLLHQRLNLTTPSEGRADRPHLDEPRAGDLRATGRRNCTWTHHI